MIKQQTMLKVGWFAELKPAQKIVEEKIFEIIKKNYRQYGFTPIETPSVERTEVLTAKGGWEVSNQIFGLYWLAQEDFKKYSLHFDLTVPFARYILDYKGEITFPFKRSQIQKVWRWERQQRGRSREFYQADIDAIWEETTTNDEPGAVWKNLFYDSEVISIWYKTYLEIFKAFDLDLKIKININNKRIISGFVAALWVEEKFREISEVIDRKDKIDAEKFREDLIEVCWEEITEKIISFTNFEATFDNLDEVIALVGQEDIESLQELGRWISELKIVLENLYNLWIDKEDVIINLWIIRGLDYYTGTIFETFIDGDRGLWSIASGWRYEWLTKFLDKKANYSGVGFSLWITRFEDYLFEKLDTAELPQTTSEYLIINSKETTTIWVKLYSFLAEKWKKVELFPDSDKQKKQTRYAFTKGIKYLIYIKYTEDNCFDIEIKKTKTRRVVREKNIRNICESFKNKYYKNTLVNKNNF